MVRLRSRYARATLTLVMWALLLSALALVVYWRVERELYHQRAVDFYERAHLTGSGIRCKCEVTPP